MIATMRRDGAVALGSSRSCLKVSPSSLAAVSIRDPIFLKLKSCVVANSPVIVSASLSSFLNVGTYQLMGKIARLLSCYFERRHSVRLADSLSELIERGSSI